MIDTQPPERGDLTDSDPKELAPFSLEYLPWEPRRAPTWAVTKAIGAVIVGVGLASVGAFAIFDRVGLPTPAGVPQLELRAARMGDAPVVDTSAVVEPTVQPGAAARATAAPPVIVATAVPRAIAEPRAVRKRVVAHPVRPFAGPPPAAALVAPSPEVAPTDVAPTDVTETERVMPYEPAPEVPSLDWLPADVQPGEPGRFVPSEP